jgi:hypothetical protein
MKTRLIRTDYNGAEPYEWVPHFASLPKLFLSSVRIRFFCEPQIRVRLIRTEPAWREIQERDRYSGCPSPPPFLRITTKDRILQEGRRARSTRRLASRKKLRREG